MVYSDSEEYDNNEMTEIISESCSFLELKPEEAREFLFNTRSYCSIDLPKYFDFNVVLQCARKIVGYENKFRYRLGKNKVRTLDNVNHLILSNKNAAYGWRLMQLVHPILYVELVSLITEPKNWQELQKRFEEFQNEECKIKCESIPFIEKNASSKETNIHNWWINFEQESVRLALYYKYIASTDITDCYGALYTHTVAWSIYGKEEAKKKQNDKEQFGNKIDRLLMDMHNGQTNGIPQGNVASDLIAEMVLGYADLNLSGQLNERKINDYRILRYRDDYRIFTNSKEDAQIILLELTNVLSDLNFKLNAAKTFLSEDIIGASIKADKQFWNQSINSRRSFFKTLLFVHDLGRRFPNSGSLVKALTHFRRRIEKLSKRPNDNAILISLIVDIMYHNPRIYPHAASILSKLLSFENYSDKINYLKLIHDKFEDIPNRGILEIWMQRISLNYTSKFKYQESMCKAVTDQSIILWNCEWLKKEAKESIKNASIINQEELEKNPPVITPEETEAFIPNYEDDLDTED